MAFALRRAATRLRSRRIGSSRRLSSTAIPDVALDAIPSSFIQTPPFWVRYTWPLIIGNALLVASAIDITWHHWSTLVKDLEAVGERNRQIAAAAEAKHEIDTPASSAPAIETTTTVDQTDTLLSEASSTPVPTSAVDTSEEEESTHNWERRPAWQRAGFCGVYAIGWAFSTAYLLKYRQTYVTRVKFFRGPSSPKPPPPPPPAPASSSSKTIPSPPPAKFTRGSSAILPPTKTKGGPQENRFIHIQTASKPKGVTIPLTKVSLYEGRNETELVIRSNPTSSGRPAKWRWNRTGREYWFMSLSEAIVDGTRFAKVESARDGFIRAWFQEEGKKKKKKKAGKKA